MDEASHEIQDDTLNDVVVSCDNEQRLTQDTCNEEKESDVKSAEGSDEKTSEGGNNEDGTTEQIRTLDAKCDDPTCCWSDPTATPGENNIKIEQNPDLSASKDGWESDEESTKESEESSPYSSCDDSNYIDDPTCCWSDPTATPGENDKKIEQNPDLSASEDGWESDEESTNESEESSSNSSCDETDDSKSMDESDNNDVTNIKWIAGYEQELREENVQNFIHNLTIESTREITCKIFVSKEGQGEITVGKEIGKGGFGSVRKGQWMTTCQINAGNVTCKDVAIKMINYKDMKELTSPFYNTELKALTRLNHPNIVKLYFIVINAQSTCLGLELASGGDLYDYIRHKGPLTLKQARIWFGQLVDAVQHCHLNGIAHRDIKPENILIDEKMAMKLTDFDASLVQPNRAEITAEQFNSSGIIGTLYYTAPEIFSGNLYDSRKCDIWSLGVVLYEMLTGHIPFSFRNLKVMEKLTEEDLAGSNYFHHVNKLYNLSSQSRKRLCRCGSARGLILKMLELNAKDRATILEISSELLLLPEF